MNGALQHCLVQMMAAHLPTVCIHVHSGCGKHPLPLPFDGRIRVFSLESFREDYTPGTTGNVRVMLPTYFDKVSLQ